MHRHVLSDAFLAAMIAAGVPRNDDYNGASQEGVSFNQVMMRDGRRVWNWANGETFTRAFTPVILGPSEKLNCVAAWNQLSNRGKQVPPGTYVVRGWITLDGSHRRLEMQERVEIVR